MKKEPPLTKAERREQQRPRMKVSGSSVKQIQRLLIERSKGKKRAG